MYFIEIYLSPYHHENFQLPEMENGVELFHTKIKSFTTFVHV